MPPREGVTKNMAPEVTDEEAARLKAASRSTILQSASDALWRTIDHEKRSDNPPDSDLEEAHTLVRRVMHRWQGGG